MKKILLWFLGVSAMLYGLMVFIVPSIVDKKYNTTSNPPPYQASSAAIDLYKRLDFVADLHCDALLWGRDLSKSNDFGHVDLPRMQQAHLALQVFSIVTKNPKT